MFDKQSTVFDKKCFECILFTLTDVWEIKYGYSKIHRTFVVRFFSLQIYTARIGNDCSLLGLLFR